MNFKTIHKIAPDPFLCLRALDLEQAAKQATGSSRNLAASGSESDTVDYF